MKKITHTYITSLLFVFICLLIFSCEPETFETPKEEIVPLKMELEKDTVWSMTGQETEITIISNKEIEVIYTIAQGEIQVKKKMVPDDSTDDKKQSGENNDPEKPADETDPIDPSIIQDGAKITLQKGKNTFTVFTDKYQGNGIMLHFMPAEKNTSDKNTNHKIQPLKLRVWTSEPYKEEFKVVITHDTPDTLFLQYKPVRFELKIVPEPGADTSGYYTYEYEMIQGDAIVRLDQAAPYGTKIKPEERKSIAANSAIALYATPLTTEPTWLRILVRKDFGVTRVEGAILHMDSIKPRGLPGVSVSRIVNMGNTGDPGGCIANKNSCIGDRVFYHLTHVSCYGADGVNSNCYISGAEGNTKIKHRIYFKQNEYYVPKQKYRLKVDLAGTQLLSKQELSIIPYQGQSALIDYDTLIQNGYVSNGEAYLDFDINMPNHDNVIIGTAAGFKSESLQLWASLHNEEGVRVGRYFYLTFAKFNIRRNISIPQPKPPK